MDETLLVEVLEYRAREGQDTKLSPKVATILTEYIRLLEKRARLYPTIETIRSDIAGIGADYTLDA